MSQKQIQAILDTMAALPQRFIWKWESDTLLADKNKLYVGKWLPQVDILGMYLRLKNKVEGKIPNEKSTCEDPWFES